MDFPQGKYNIIYADPPWSYRDKNLKHGGAAAHYSTMSAKELNSLPVEALAADDCFLFLWVTFPNLKEGIALLEDWGFKYKTLGFSWVKQNVKSPGWFFGIGHYTRSNCEVCLIGVRGKPKVVAHNVSSLVIAPRGRHSAKPSEVRERIVQLCGDLPRIELFARDVAEGWDCWGNEVIKE